MCSQRSNSVTEKWSYRPKILKLKEIQRNTQKICSGWKRLLEMPATKHHWLLLGAPELPLLSGCSLRRWSKSKRYRQLPSMSPDVFCFFFFLQKTGKRVKLGTARSQRMPHSPFVTFTFLCQMEGPASLWSFSFTMVSLQAENFD